MKCPIVYKSDLIKWAASWFNKPESHFRKMSKKQLYAIWHKEQNKRREQNECNRRKGVCSY